MTKLMTYLSEQKKKTLEAFHLFQHKPLESAAMLLPLLIFAISLIAFVVSLGAFIMNGGYAQQFSHLKNGLLQYLEGALTLGTVKMQVTGIVPILTVFLALVDLLVILGVFFTSVSKIKKVIGIILLSLCGLTTVTLMTLMTLDKQDVALPFVTREMAWVMMGIAGLTGLAMVILLLLNHTRELILHGITALLCTFVIFPLLLLLLENIIAAAIFVVIVLLALGAAKLVAGIVNTPVGDGSSEKKSAAKEQKASPAKAEAKKTPIVLEKNYSDEDVFFRDKGGIGFMTPQGTNGINIYVRRHQFTQNKHEYVCDAYEYDRGKYIIKTKSGKIVKV